MSVNQNQNRRVRASSAKVSNDRVRPSSGNSHKNANKIDFIQNMYGGVFTTKRYSNKVPTKLGFLGEENDGFKATQSRNHKQREQLVEENMQLKKEINMLKQELTLQKGKTQQMRKKNSEFTKQLNIKYNKQIYWTNNGPDMIRGVKQQYQQMKMKYQEKCLQYDLLTQEYVFSQSREERVYADMLYQENQKLIKRLNEAKEEMKYVQHGTLTSAVQQSIDLYKRYKFEIQQQNENLSLQIDNLKLKVKTLKEELGVRQQKIAYLDQLLIQRDNSQSAAWRKVKKLEKEKQDIMNKFNQYKHEKQDAVTNYQAKIKRIKETLQKQSQTQRQIFKHELQEKSTRIIKLQKEIAYLTTLLSYWKPLDQVNYLVSNNIMQENRQNPDYDRQVLLEYSMGSTMIKYNVSRHNAHNPPNEEQYETKSIISKSRKGSGDNTKNAVVQIMTKSIDITKKQPQKRKRTQMTADKRNTEEGVKSRKITHNEIADICETLNYRFIGFGISIDEIRNYFDYNPNIDMVEDEQQQNWISKYINMKEVNKILTNDVFGLNQNDALALSRYLVQDCPTDYVYCDPNNQQLRSVIKSIIKNLIGEYEVNVDRSKIIKQSKDLLQRYRTNLESALKVTAPKGFISKKKLVQLFKGLGIEMSSQLQDYFIGKVVIKSQNLNNLRYEILFQA